MFCIAIMWHEFQTLCNSVVPLVFLCVIINAYTEAIRSNHREPQSMKTNYSSALDSVDTLQELFFIKSADRHFLIVFQNHLGMINRNDLIYTHYK